MRNVVVSEVALKQLPVLRIFNEDPEKYTPYTIGVQAILLYGPPGVGKTKLAMALQEKARSAGYETLYVITEPTRLHSQDYSIHGAVFSSDVNAICALAKNMLKKKPAGAFLCIDSITNLHVDAEIASNQKAVAKVMQEITESALDYHVPAYILAIAQVRQAFTRHVLGYAYRPGMAVSLGHTFNIIARLMPKDGSRKEPLLEVEKVVVCGELPLSVLKPFDLLALDEPIFPFADRLQEKSVKKVVSLP